MTRASIREYLATQRRRYVLLTRPQRRAVIDEVVAVTRYHRKAVIRALRDTARPPRSLRRVGRPRRYGAEVAAAAEVLWEAAGQIGAKRLHPFIAPLVRRLMACGELRVTLATEQALGQVSVATLERLLAGARRTRPRRGVTTTRPGTWLKQQIPMRTFAEWDDARPGFLEIDLVAHCGARSKGFFLYTLCAVDVATSWVELAPVWGKGHYRVGAAIHELRRRLPMPLRGIDSDNGSEFINRPLYYYCDREGITFTRSRAWKKNDSAHVEQKNGALVRQLIGYDRYACKAAYAQLARVYALVRLHSNFFQPVQRLLAKQRDGARLRRWHDRAQTPFQRLCAAGVLSTEAQRELEDTYERLNPLQLRRQIDRELATLWRFAIREPRAGIDSPRTFAR